MKNEEKEKGNENTGIAMRVLSMTAILVMLCLFSVQSVSAVQVTENVKFQTPGTNTTFIMGSDFNFDTIEVHSTDLRLNDAVISVCPSAGSIDFTLFSFSIEYRKWNESCSNPDAITDHTMGGLKTNTPYDVRVNGVIYGQYRSNESGYVFFTYSGGYSDIVFEMEETGAPPKFIAHFMTPEGEPYPFDVTISDGTWRKEWKDVTYIETEVPCDATYKLSYSWKGDEMLYRIRLDLSPGELREFDFYALDLVEIFTEGLRNRPYLLFQERGANANLSWNWDPDTLTLNWTLFRTPGKYVGVDVTIDENTNGLPNYGVQLLCSVDAWIADTLVVTPTRSYWEDNIIVVVDGEYYVFSIAGDVGFIEIDPALGTIMVNGLWKDNIINVPITLRDLQGIEYPPQYVIPQYAVPAGNYILEVSYTPPGIGKSIVNGIPCRCAAGEGLFFDIYFSKLTDLDPFSFSILAENAFAKSWYSGLTHDEETNTLSVNVTTETEHDWWGYFVLPDDVTVAAVRSRMPGAWHDLDELYDYTINPVDGYKIVVVRISPETEQVMLAYKVVEPDLVITEKRVCWPDTCTICYNVKNIGNKAAPACHNTALYVDSVEVAHDHVPVPLAPGESYVGCFDGYTWTYTPPSDDITVCADNSETIDELDEDNNCLTNIWMCGDVNGDGKVTMSDVRKVFNRYLDPNYPLDLPWAADVNCDGKVTMSDVRKVFNRYLDPGYELNCCCEGVG